MADIFALADVLIVIFFIVPGFVSLSIIRHVGLFENELSDKELVIWSVLFSLIIYTIFALKFNVQNIDDLRQSIFDWEQTVWIIGLSLGLGFLIGYIIKFVYRRNTHRGKIWNYLVKKIPDMERYSNVRVVTEEKEYEGQLFYWGTDYTPRDIVLANPKLIVTKNNKEEKIDQGKELFIPESSIKSVNFLDSVSF